MRVLLVDNDDIEAVRSETGLRDRLGDALSVRHVSSLGQAIRALGEQTFDVVLLELAVHDATGVTTLSGVRGAGPSVPVVVYSRSMDDDLAIRALQAGAQECLAKADTEPRHLARALQFAIERQRLLESIESARSIAAHRASHDPLTGLPNRDLILGQLDRALAFGARYGRKTGILFVDLDGFKEINDVHGHACGDDLLRVVSTRLLDSVRRSDAVARLGGDEFVVLLPDVTSRLDIAHVRDAILTCLLTPIDVGGAHALRVDASIGSAMSPLDGLSAQDLLDAADAAMYRDKAARRRARTSGAHGEIAMPLERTEMQPAVSQTDSGVGARDNVVHAASAPASASAFAPAARSEERLREGIRQHEFEVHFQPIVDIGRDRIVALEALVRWRDPLRGLLFPSAFLGLAEDTGLIVPLGEFVLRAACQSIARWRQQAHACALRVHVNISAVQLREKDFPTRVASILAETGCPMEALVFELTENSMLVDGDTAIESLRALKVLGARLIVDDFGVGFASLTFVREAPVSGIKLDRRFVANMLNDPRDHAIVVSMIRLAQGLNLDVIAEGVESAQHALHLSAMTCHLQQGQYFSARMPVVATDEWLAEDVSFIDEDGTLSPLVVSDGRPRRSRDARAAG